ncbi:MAG: tandem-95 repeat protein, partial [Gemmatimonadetes bacterium]|nr:tandem-95 repeat protein [Gemmatimonadota bacterium]
MFNQYTGGCMVKYALSMALILLLGTCGDRGAGPKTGRIALDVQDPAPPGETNGTVVQGVDRMVVTVLQNETVVMSEDLRYEGGVWLGELTVSTGSYSVVVEAYKGAIVKWRGSALVLVKGGQSSRVVIALTSTNQVPVLADIGDQTIAEGRTLTILLVGSDADGDALTYAVEGEPAGSSLSGSTFTWEPSHTQAGEYSVTFAVADEHGGVAREIIIITVDETNQGPELADVGNQNADVDKVLTIILEGSDADGDELTYSVEGEPTGASLAEQTFNWKPSSSQVGTYQVTFTVEDGRGGSDSQNVTINVEANQIPELVSIGPYIAEEGSALTIILEGSDADGDELTYSVEGEPTGASLAEQTFSWKPSYSQSGEYEVTFTVEDGRGGIDRETITITVKNTNREPELAAIGDQTVAGGHTLTIALAGNDADGDVLIYTVENNPSGSSLSGAIFTWRPSDTEAGMYQVTFRVEDEHGGQAAETIVITVKSRLRRLTNHDAEDMSPSWSPDGTLIAFQSNRDGNWAIYVMDADGNNLRRLPNRDAGDGSPS